VSLRKDLQALPSEMQLTAVAAMALAVSLILPWYQKSYFQGQKVVQANVSALGVFTFVEAAVLLVALAVLFLVWSRSQRKGFHLPGGDGVAITMAGGWALVLLVWRLFDKPDIKGVGVTVGIQWGIFGALLAAGALVAAGARVRAAHRPEPPNPAADEVGWVAPSRTPREPRSGRRPRDATAVTDALRERPAWEGEPGEPPSRARRAEEPHWRPSEDEETRRFRDDDPPTRRLRDDEATRRLRDDEATRRLRDDEATRRLPDDEATRRLPDDAATRRPHEDEETRRFRDDDPPTRRLPNDDATRRLPADEDPATRRLPREPTGRLWDEPDES
jgi:hypothetical protein